MTISDDVIYRALRESIIAWEVCASIHREYAKGKDALFNTRQSDFVKHANDCREALDKFTQYFYRDQ